eukprot:Sdes_comp20793_c0_seq1m17030
MYKLTPQSLCWCSSTKTCNCFAKKMDSIGENPKLNFPDHGPTIEGKSPIFKYPQNSEIAFILEKRYQPILLELMFYQFSAACIIPLHLSCIDSDVLPLPLSCGLFTFLSCGSYFHALHRMKSKIPHDISLFIKSELGGRISQYFHELKREKVNDSREMYLQHMKPFQESYEKSRNEISQAIKAFETFQTNIDVFKKENDISQDQIYVRTH